MMTVTFNEVAIYGQKSTKCANNCGRTLRRSKKFWQTLSPFNRSRAGGLKSKDEIYTELRVEQQTWLKEPEVCKHCRVSKRNNQITGRR